MNSKPNVAHVLPIDDTVEHDVCESCICGPDITTIVFKNNQYGLVIKHHSLDGRELNERTNS